MPRGLTALNVLSGAVGLELQSAVAGAVSFDTARGKVREELNMYVNQFECIHLFEYVVNLGATTNLLSQQLLEFGAKFVDQNSVR